MTVVSKPVDTTTARDRLTADGGAFLVSDWAPALFVHLEVDPDALRRHTPFELDLHDGRAFVSLVAFAMRRMRIADAPRPCDRLAAVAHSLYLNARTYVRHEGEPGIVFLREWLDSSVQHLLAPRAYGLPLHKAKLTLQADADLLHAESRVASPRDGGELHLRARRAVSDGFTPAEADSLDHFLVERYTAFTQRGDVRRRFRIAHEPWSIAPVDAELLDVSLLRKAGVFPADFRLASSHLTPGLTEVRIARPVCVNGPACLRRWSDTLPEGAR